MIDKGRLNEIIEEALAEVDDSWQYASSPHLAPRRLGATAPHDPSLWTVDYRDHGQGRLTPGIRTFATRGLEAQMDLLLAASLRVKQ